MWLRCPTYSVIVIRWLVDTVIGSARCGWCYEHIRKAGIGFAARSLPSGCCTLGLDKTFSTSTCSLVGGLSRGKPPRRRYRDWLAFSKSKSGQILRTLSGLWLANAPLARDTLY